MSSILLDVVDTNGCYTSIDSVIFIYDCEDPTAILDLTNNQKSLLKITNVLGKETSYRKNSPLIYIYDDGTVEKRIVID